MADGVIFDFDGTIADTLPVCIAAFQETFARHGGPDFDGAEVRSLFGPSEEGVLINVLGAAEGKEALGTYLDQYTRLHHRAAEPFPGIKPLLDTLLSKGVRLAIVTGKGPQSVRISLDYIGLGGYFDPVEAGSPDGSVKAPAMTRVCSRWRVDPSEVISVGDHIMDIRHGHRAGTHTVGAAWARPESEATLAAEAPDALFVTVSAFGEWLLERV